MSDSMIIDLFNRQQAWVDINNRLFPRLKECLAGGGMWVLELKRKKRTKAQNRRYWGNGVLAQIAHQAVVNGRKYEADVWHEQLKRMFIGVIELPNGQVIGKSSTALTTKEFCEFCDKVEAWAATELGVTFYDLEPHHRDIEARRPARKREMEAA